MIIKDSSKLHKIGNSNFPVLKGHIKLTLHNVHNGKNEVYEGENIVTNAVADIMSANYLGSVDYSKITGTDGIWKKWYGGVLAYETAHANLDADKYYPYSEGHNHLVAHAGQNPIDANHDDDLRRGNPTPSSRVIEEHSVKQVWEWGTTHGNGNISALSLCHSDVGDAGLGSAHYAFQNFVPFDAIDVHTTPWSNFETTHFGTNNIQAMYDDNHALTFWVGELTDPTDDSRYNLNSDTISVYIRKLAYLKAGLFDTQLTSTDLEVSFEVETPIMFYGQPCYYFDYNTKYLWLFSNMSSDTTYSKTNIDYCIIDCVNKALVDLGSGVYMKTIVSDTENIAPLAIGYSNRRHYANLIKDGNYIYFPTSSSPSIPTNVAVTGLKKISLSSASQDTITFSSTARTIQTAMSSGSDFIILPNAFDSVSRVVNGNNAYICANQFTMWNDIYEKFFISSPYSPSSYAVSTENAAYSQSVTRQRYILANKLLNTTKYNLPSTVQKTASQSMMIEYTLQETEEE